MKAIGYIRVSTQEQAKEGISLKMQEDRIRAYCYSQDWKLIRVFNDEGFSGKNMKRKGLQDLLSFLETDHVDVVVVYKTDRLTRKQRHLYHLLEDRFERKGIGFKSVTEAFDTTTAMGKGFLGMLGLFAQLEGDLISERTREAFQHKKQNGEPVGSAALGFRLQDKKKIENPAELKIVAYVKALRRKRLSYREIAKRLNEEGVPTKRGGRWFGSTVSYILKNESYKGMKLGI